MLNIKRCQIQDLSLFSTDARHAGLIFSSSTELYGIWLDNILIGMTGIVPYTRCWKIKNGFIQHEYRHRGFYNSVLDQHIHDAKLASIKYFLATCTQMSLNIWLKKGAVVTYQYQRYTSVRLLL